MIATANPSVADVQTLVTIIEVVFLVVGVGGTVSLAGWWRARRKAIIRDAIRNDALDKVIDEETGVFAVLRHMQETLNQINERGTRNLREHVEKSEAEHRRLWRAIDRLQGRQE